VYYAVHAASPGQAGDSSPLLNAEPSRARAATQRREPFKRDARRAGDELEQTQTPRVVVAFHGRPEPLDHLVLIVVACHQPTRRLSSTLSSTGKDSAPKIIITHTHPFNDPLSRTTRVGRYQKGKTTLDLTEVRDSEWQWHQLGHMQVCTSLRTDNHASTSPLSFLQAGCPSCRATNSVKALKKVCQKL